MTTTARDSPDSMLTLLFGPGEGAPETLLEASLPRRIEKKLGATWGKLPQVTREVAAREIAATATQLLGVNLIDVLAAGWRDYHELTEMARRTLAPPPGNTELSDLLSHQITQTLQPSISILVDGHCVATLQLCLSVICDIQALLVQVTAGRMVAVHSGRCDITATLLVEDVQVMSRSARVHLPGAIKLDPGLRLLPTRDYPPAEHSRQRAGYAAGAGPVMI
jgi:hypothetical protein